ncbi:hypothetical protein J5A58_12175 [Prevotella melaninogenica]|uniref:Uncharacterized protein n=1 Tax=Prevotella melaninogenica TaxID=28132 RepID=A0ABX7XSE2_9BACT|nr:hypothetical protein [Prevotella melaninogenica]QUB76478.1 hypothetical protein J5A58_12175 [Prevotella melaninogenica]
MKIIFHLTVGIYTEQALDLRNWTYKRALQTTYSIVSTRVGTRCRHQRKAFQT